MERRELRRGKRGRILGEFRDRGEQLGAEGWRGLSGDASDPGTRRDFDPERSLAALVAPRRILLPSTIPTALQLHLARQHRVLSEGIVCVKRYWNSLHQCGQQITSLCALPATVAAACLWQTRSSLSSCTGTF